MEGRGEFHKCLHYGSMIKRKLFDWIWMLKKIDKLIKFHVIVYLLRCLFDLVVQLNKHYYT